MTVYNKRSKGNMAYFIHMTTACIKTSRLVHCTTGLIFFSNVRVSDLIREMADIANLRFYTDAIGWSCLHAGTQR